MKPYSSKSNPYSSKSNPYSSQSIYHSISKHSLLLSLPLQFFIWFFHILTLLCTRFSYAHAKTFIASPLYLSFSLSLSLSLSHCATVILFHWVPLSTQNPHTNTHTLSLRRKQFMGWTKNFSETFFYLPPSPLFRVRKVGSAPAPAPASSYQHEHLFVLACVGNELLAQQMPIFHQSLRPK